MYGKPWYLLLHCCEPKTAPKIKSVPHDATHIHPMCITSADSVLALETAVNRLYLQVGAPTLLAHSPTHSKHYPLHWSWCSVTQWCLTLGDPMNCSMPGFPVHHQPLPELAQTLAHWVSDVILSSHPPLFPSPPAFNPSQHQDLFQWISFWHQVAKILEFQLQHQSFRRVFRLDFL